MLSAVGETIVVSCPLEEYTLFGLATFGTSHVPPVLLGSSRPFYVQNTRFPYCEHFASALKAGNVENAAAALRPILWAANRLHNRFVNRGGHNVALVKYITELLGMAGGRSAPRSAPLRSSTWRTLVRCSANRHRGHRFDRGCCGQRLSRLLMYVELHPANPEWAAVTIRDMAAFGIEHRSELDSASRDARFPRDLYVEMGRRGWVGPMTPIADGGSGGGVAEYCLVRKRLDATV